MPKTRKNQDFRCKCGGSEFEAATESRERSEFPTLRCVSCGASVRVDKTTLALHRYAKSGSASADFLRLFDMN